MAKREPGVGQVGAKNTKNFLPLPRRSPPARAAQEQTPLWSMPQTKEKNAKKNKTTARRFMAPQTAPQRTTQHAGTPKQLQTRRGGKTRKLWEATCSSVCVS